MRLHAGELDPAAEPELRGQRARRAFAAAAADDGQARVRQPHAGLAERRDRVEQPFLLDEPAGEQHRGGAVRRPARVLREVEGDRVDQGPLRRRAGGDHLLAHLRPFGEKQIAVAKQPRVALAPLRQVRQHRGVDAVEAGDQRQARGLGDRDHLAADRAEVRVHRDRADAGQHLVHAPPPRRAPGRPLDRRRKPPRGALARRRLALDVDARKRELFRVLARMAQDRRLVVLMAGHDRVDERFAARQKPVDGVHDARHHGSSSGTMTARLVRYDSTPARHASTVRPASAIEHIGWRRSRIAPTKSWMAPTQASECS